MLSGRSFVIRLISQRRRKMMRRSKPKVLKKHRRKLIKKKFWKILKRIDRPCLRLVKSAKRIKLLKNTKKIVKLIFLWCGEEALMSAEA